jgi:type II secretory pathway pseudopilin PulG
MNTRSRGFTVIELIVIVLVLAAASVLFFIQKSNVEVAARDDSRKTAVNAFYYSLEEVYFETNGHYPLAIDAATLPSVDPNLFKDPNGNVVGTSASDYRYEPTNCTDSKCASYTIRTVLENEDDFVKESKN